MIKCISYEITFSDSNGEILKNYTFVHQSDFPLSMETLPKNSLVLEKAFRLLPGVKSGGGIRFTELRELHDSEVTSDVQ